VCISKTFCLSSLHLTEVSKPKYDDKMWYAKKKKTQEKKNFFSWKISFTFCSIFEHPMFSLLHGLPLLSLGLLKPPLLHFLVLVQL
jgi:hypothetical protein